MNLLVSECGQPPRISNTNQIQSSLPNGKIDFDLICCAHWGPFAAYDEQSEVNKAKGAVSANEINNEINQIKIILICLIELFCLFDDM